MKITEKQEKILNGLQCVRLSSDEAHLRLVDDFYVPRNPNLADPLQNEAFGDDMEGNMAYYVVKNLAGGEILFYFSLKCGMLYDKYKDEDILLFKKFVSSLEEIQKDTDLSEEDRQVINMIRERLRIHKGITKEQLQLFKRENRAINDMKVWLEDTNRAVGKTFAGVEIVHFVANDRYSELWHSLDVGQKLGVVVFWKFIVPIIEEVMKLVGCQYVFLFAADNTPDETLVNYYRTMLQFDDIEEHNTTVPFYDFSCKLMYQETAGLKEKKQYFFEHFNLDENDV